MDVIPVTEIRVWKSPLSLRLVGSALWGLFVTGLLAAQVAAIVQSGWAGLVVLPSLLIFSTIAIIYMRYVWLAKMTASDGGVTVRRGRRTSVIPWSMIGTCTCGYYGMTISQTDGVIVRAAWPQKANISTWLRRETSGDRAAAYLMRRAEQHRSRGLESNTQ